MSLKYTCPGCGTPLGYEGLCWKCKCEQERQAALAWTPEQIVEKQRNLIQNIQRLADMEDPEFADFWQLLGYHDAITPEIQRVALAAEVFWPCEIYYHAPADVRDGLIHALLSAEYSSAASNLMSCLAMQGAKNVPLRVFSAFLNQKGMINMGMISYVKQEIEVIRERDPAIKSNMEVFLYPSFKVILSYRVAHKLYLKKHYFWARWISQRAARKTGIEIHPGATIGKGLFIDHGTGVIIGETTIIGDNVTLYQGVTLGGTGKEQGKRHPTLKDNVMVSAGAKILGSFTIGENSKIGAGSVVLEEVPPNCTVVGVPGRIVRMDNKKVPRSDMDQVHLPDPVLIDIRELQEENIKLHKRLESMIKYMRCVEKENKESKNDEDL